MGYRCIPAGPGGSVDLAPLGAPCTVIVTGGGRGPPGSAAAPRATTARGGGRIGGCLVGRAGSLRASRGSHIKLVPRAAFADIRPSPVRPMTKCALGLLNPRFPLAGELAPAGIRVNCNRGPRPSTRITAGRSRTWADDSSMRPPVA